MLETLKFCLSSLLTFSSLSSQKATFPRYLEISPHEMTLSSVSASKKQGRENRVWQLKTGEVVFNGTKYSQMRSKILPYTGVPVFYQKPSQDTPDTPYPLLDRHRIRLVFLPGFGSNLSHAGSLLSVARLFSEMEQGVHSTYPVIQKLAHDHPSSLRKFEVVAFDLPGAGWAPPLDDFHQSVDLAHYIRDVVGEIDAQDDIPTVLVSRSGSGPLSVMAAHEGLKILGMVLTAPTFPDSQVLDENLADVEQAVSRGEYQINPEILEGILARLSQPDTLDGVEKGSRHLRQEGLFSLRPPMMLLAMSGTHDPQVSARARALWEKHLGRVTLPQLIVPSREVGMGPLSPQGHLTLDGAHHFVFARPFQKTEVQTHDPDYVALRAILERLEWYSSRYSHDWLPVPF